MGEGGIVADGQLTFKKEDGSPFLATFEATAGDSMGEVLFHPQPVLLNMDSLATGVVFGTLVLGFLYADKWQGFEYIGKYWAILVGFGVGAAIFYSVRRLIRKLPRYRYIFAIEQFKQYFADQQWIALGADVFPDPTDKHYKELRDQCVKFGFGLLLVDENLKAQLVITPARVQAVGKRRRLLRFEDAQAWTRRMTERIKPERPIIRLPSVNKWTESFQLPSWLKWTQRFSLPDFSLNRYQRSYFNQMLIIVLGFCAASAMLYDLYKIPPVRYPDEDAYVEELEILTQTGKRETGQYLIDTPFLEQYNKIPHSPNPMADDPTPVREIFRDSVLPPPLASTLVPGLEPPPPPAAKPKPDKAKPSSIGAYDCDRFYGIKGSRYLVVYGGLVGEEALARQKLDTVSNAGIEAGLLWMGCFEVQSGEFAVYLGPIFKTMEEASSQKIKFEIALQEQGVKFAPLKLRPLVFKGGG